MFMHSFLILLAGCALALVLHLVKTRFSRLWGLVAFTAVVGMAASLLYWPGQYTPKDRLPLGIDLAGGTTLVYDVQVPDNAQDPASVIVDRTIATLSKRVDPTGTRNLIWRRLGDKRLQVQMPAPNAKVSVLRQQWEDARNNALSGSLTSDKLEEQLAAGITGPGLSAVQAAWKERAESKAAYNALDAAEKANPAKSAAFMAAEDRYFAAKKQYASAMAAALKTGSFSAALLDKLVEIPAAEVPLTEDEIKAGQTTRRQKYLADLQKDYPARAEKLAKALAAFEEYEKVKGALETPEDLDRLLQGSGRVEFRIAPRTDDPELGDPSEFIRKLRERGPRSFTDKDAYAWFEIDSLAQYLDIQDTKAERLQFFAERLDLAKEGLTSDRVIAAIGAALEASTDSDPQKADASARKVERLVASRGVVAKVYNGKIYVLLGNDVKRNAMTAAQGWAVKSPHMSFDQIGKPCVSFSMDQQGAALLGDMTGAHVGRLMAVLLDGRILTTPNLQSKLSDGGQITGSYTPQEVDYLVNTMRAGSLDGRISGAPVSQKTTGPELGGENLEMGMSAALWSFIVVGAFMVFYYFVPGLTAIIALVANLLLVLGIMAVFNSTFTMPGIAGMVLTIGIAVDANVLIYERIREETFHGKELLSAIHDGHHRSMATIIDSHVTQLLVAWVLAGLPPFNLVETPADLKGFAVTLGIGILVSLFTSLFGAYVFLDLYVWVFKPRKIHMLPTVWPGLQRALTPNIPWVRLGRVFLPITSILCVVAIVFAVSRGKDLLDVEFRAGSQVGFRLKEEAPGKKDAEGKSIRQKLKLEDVRERIGEVIRVATLLQQDRPVPTGQAALSERVRPIVRDAKARHAEAEKEFAAGRANAPEAAVDFTQFSAEYLIGVGKGEKDPKDGESRYGEFSLKTLITDSRAVTEVVQTALAGDLDAEPSVSFAGASLAAKADGAHLIPVVSANLAEVLKRDIPAGVDADVREYQGGVAVVVEGLKPALTLPQMQERLKRMRNQPPHDKLEPRHWKVVPLEAEAGSGDSKTWSAFAVVTADDQTSYINDAGSLFGSGGLAVTQRELVHDALQRATAFDDVTVFGSQVSGTMQKDAFFALLVSFLGIAGYVWFRFNAVRFGIATVIALLHDVGVALGAIALSGWLSHTALGRMLDIHDFKMNLAMVAALLTVMGYSVNDTVVVFDRIREYRGKVKVVTAQHINDAINHTLSRTLLTTGTVIISSVMLYAIGGPAVHGFAFAMLVGVLTGTWSSIALAAPLLLLGSGGGLDMADHEDELADMRLQPSAPGEPVGV